MCSTYRFLITTGCEHLPICNGAIHRTTLWQKTVLSPFCQREASQGEPKRLAQIYTEELWQSWNSNLSLDLNSKGVDCMGTWNMELPDYPASSFEKWPKILPRYIGLVSFLASLPSIINKVTLRAAGFLYWPSIHSAFLLSHSVFLLSTTHLPIFPALSLCLYTTPSSWVPLSCPAEPSSFAPPSGGCQGLCFCAMSGHSGQVSLCPSLFC